MADQQVELPVEEERKEVANYYCRLPIPCVKGKPVDYQRMNVDQLKRFINFMYKSQFKLFLPNNVLVGAKIPPWWPQTVTFEKNLRFKINPKASQKSTNGLQKELVSLVKSCYEFVGVPSMLAVAKELSVKDSEYSLKKSHCSQSAWDVTDPQGQTMITIDDLTLTYDANPRGRDVFGDKECQENMHANPKPQSKARQIKNQRSKKRATVKRKLFKREEITEEEESHPCRYCGKIFSFKEFSEEHESHCLRGPTEPPSQLDFMNALGMLGRKQEKAKPTSAQDLDERPKIRVLRKVTKKSQLINLIKTHPIPLASERGQKFIAEYGEKAEVSFPPEYEKQCKPRSGYPVCDKEYPVVAKRAILKNGDHPHIYSKGRRQRTVRYQELVVGVNTGGWALLNKVRKSRVCIEKLRPTMKNILLPKGSKKSFLETKWRPALEFPKVHLVDFKFNMTPEILKYFRQQTPKSPKPGSSKST